ncbi:MAG: hypothetical protein J6Y20_07025 [Lachnospiraceae bacterium]|nr:hypothetical protein [Lachnospiraceae bacterium]
MGGRGGASRRSGGGGAKPKYTAKQKKTLADTAKSLGIELSWDKLESNGVRYERIMRAFDIIRGMYSEYPGTEGLVQRITYEDKPNVYAAMDAMGTMYLGIWGTNPEVDVNMRYRSDLLSRFHPQGTVADDVIRHEMGHAMHFFITDQSGSFSGYDATTVNIVLAAAKRVNPDIKTIDDVYPLAEAISRYAVDKTSLKRHNSTLKFATWETIAEAIGDYQANREKANPLSVEINREVRRRLRKK